MKRHNLAFIDLETTGLDANKHEIIELGCIVARQVPQAGKGNDLEIIEEFEFKIKPERLDLAEPEALRINGYNDADWLFAIDLVKALEILADKTAGAMMVAQNVTFDWHFLDRAFAKTGVKNKMDFHRIDLLSMAYAKLYHIPEAQRFSLRALCDHFQVKNEQAHTALADIRATYEVYRKVLEI